MVLNSLVRVYRDVRKLDYDQMSPNKQLRESIEEAKRTFVNELLGVLDPRKREEEFNRIMPDPKQKRDRQTT